MAKKTKSSENCFGSNEGRQKLLESALPAMANGLSFFVAWVTNEESPGDCDGLPEINSTRCLVIVQGLPIYTGRLQAWREEAGRHNVTDFKIGFIEGEATEEALRQLITQRCPTWLQPLPVRESPKVEKGNWVQLGGSPGKHDPSLLSMMFGSMGDLLTRMDLISRRFHNACDLDDKAKSGHKEAIHKMLSAGSGNPSMLPTLGVPIERLPRVLLVGETGVGKTLFAKHLAGTEKHPSGAASNFRKIFIPEWLHKEDMLEYDLFGYARGAYTDGKGEGDIGKLLNVVGGVIFLDEIGTASPEIQAKLLGFMDDYKVEPRGWTKDSAFECPVLVIAATNLSLGELQNAKKFRPDLLARFTDIEEVPPLRKRMDDLPIILDCLLQNPDINPPGKREVTEIGCDAFQAIKQHEFKSNFRELENMLRAACQRAAREDRQYICKADLLIPGS